MSATAPLVDAKYGAYELRGLYQKYATRALIFATIFHLAGIGVYYGAVYLTTEDEPVYTVRIMKYSDLGPPPQLQIRRPPPLFLCLVPPPSRRSEHRFPCPTLKSALKRQSLLKRNCSRSALSATRTRPEAVARFPFRTT